MQCHLLRATEGNCSSNSSSSSEDQETPLPERVTISCTFEGGISLAFQICMAACFGETLAHGIHANRDMALNDDLTRRFSLLMQQDASDSSNSSSGIAVTQAELFLRQVAADFLKDF